MAEHDPRPVWHEDFEELVGLASDVLMDYRDIDALDSVVAAIRLRNRLNIGGGKIGALGPVELVELLDGLGARLGGDRQTGIHAIQTTRAFVAAYHANDWAAMDGLVKQLRALLRVFRRSLKNVGEGHKKS